MENKRNITEEILKKEREKDKNSCPFTYHVPYQCTNTIAQVCQDCQMSWLWRSKTEKELESL